MTESDGPLLVSLEVPSTYSLLLGIDRSIDSDEMERLCRAINGLFSCTFNPYSQFATQALRSQLRYGVGTATHDLAEILPRLHNVVASTDQQLILVNLGGIEPSEELGFHLAKVAAELYGYHELYIELTSAWIEFNRQEREWVCTATTRA